MDATQKGLLIALSILAFLWLGLDLVMAARIYSGYVIVDAPDRERPGHMTAIVISLPVLLLKAGLVVGIAGLIVWLWRTPSKSDL